jgi:hypothetical protein
VLSAQSQRTIALIIYKGSAYELLQTGQLRVLLLL